MIIIGEKTMEGTATLVRRNLRGRMRPALELHITGSDYAELAGLFVDGASFSVQYDGTVYNQSDYCLAGPITDNRDGTFTVVMAGRTPLELAQAEKDQLMLELLTERGAII